MREDRTYSDAGSCSGCGAPLGQRTGIGSAYCWDCRNGAGAETEAPEPSDYFAPKPWRNA